MCLNILAMLNFQRSNQFSVDEIKSNPTFYFLFQNRFHLDMHHNTETKTIVILPFHGDFKNWNKISSIETCRNTLSADQ